MTPAPEKTRTPPITDTNLVPVFQYHIPAWVWPDGKCPETLTVDEEAARVAAKLRIVYGGQLPPAGLVIDHYRGVEFQIVESTDGRWGVRNLNSGIVSFPPFGIEGPTLPEVSKQNIREFCGIIEVEGRVGGHDAELLSLREQVRALAAEVEALKEARQGDRIAAGLRDVAKELEA